VQIFLAPSGPKLLSKTLDQREPFQQVSILGRYISFRKQ
jgi:hypothetical protein